MHRFLCTTRSEGYDKGVTHFIRGRDLRRGEIDNDTGLGCFEAQNISWYLEFERFDEAAESVKEACSRRLKGLTPFWFPEWYVCISVELFIIQTSRSLEAKEKHKLVCEVHLLVFDEIDRWWEPQSQSIACALLAFSSADQDELQNAVIYTDTFLSVSRKRQHHVVEARRTIRKMLQIPYRHETFAKCSCHSKEIEVRRLSHQKVVDIYVKMGRVYLNCGARNKQRACSKGIWDGSFQSTSLERFYTPATNVTGRLQSKKILQQKTPPGEDMERASH